jgi:hypothetical protein
MYIRRESPQDQLGKFRPRRRLGIARETRTEYRGYSYSVTSFEQSAGVARVRYNVAVFDDLGLRRAYLRGYSSLLLATAAAHEWVDGLLASGRR